VEGANEGANTLFDTVDALFGTVNREGVENEEGANLQNAFAQIIF
jgi:hypothetical protein